MHTWIGFSQRNVLTMMVTQPILHTWHPSSNQSTPPNNQSQMQGTGTTKSKRSIYHNIICVGMFRHPHYYGGHIWWQAIDRNDRDSAEYSTTIQTHRWYLWIFFWLFDCIIHMLYMIVIYSSSNESSWKKYPCKNYGRAKFQMYLGLQLINYEIEQEWTNQDGPRPSWMHQNTFFPCNCNKCFFCLNDHCNGIYHKPDPTATVYKVDGKKRNIKGCTDEQVKFFREVFIIACVIRIVEEQLNLRKENTARTLNLVPPSVLSLYVKIVVNQGMICIKNSYFIINPTKSHVLCRH